MKKLIFTILFFFLFTSLSVSQQANTVGNMSSSCFSKIVNDPVVNDQMWGEGCAWGDYDNDGYQDLVVTSYNDNCWSCNYPIMLYHNNGDGTFTRVTTGPIATEITKAFGCSWGDYDNDGKLDLFVCTGFGMNNLLFHNDGNGQFTKVTTGAIVNDGGFSVACAWLDYDRDGWLDMFVANQGVDFLYHNNGNGTFTKITAGEIVNDNSTARSCAVGDYDNDGYPDILVTTWGGLNRLYHNNGNGTFSLTHGLIAENNSYYGGASFGDYDNDGNLDLFIAAFNSGKNELYHNNGNGTFTSVNAAPTADAGGQGFGCTWVDIDNDGLLDLYVTNWHNTTNTLYKNTGNGNFVKLNAGPITSELNWGIGNSAVDINMDGKIDLFTSNNGNVTTPLNDELYINTCQNLGNYLGIKLRGCESNKSAIGSRITVKAQGKTYTKEVATANSFHSQNMLWQLFGIGNACNVDSVIVNWPSGRVGRYGHFHSNHYITISECSCVIGSDNNVESTVKGNNNLPAEYSVSQNYPNPFNPSTKIKFSLPIGSFVNLKVYDINGKVVSTIVQSDMEAGFYELEFNAENLSSGIYYYKLTAGNYVETKKMVLVK